jgi:hypothetical protein
MLCFLTFENLYGKLKCLFRHVVWCIAFPKGPYGPKWFSGVLADDCDLFEFLYSFGFFLNVGVYKSSKANQFL